VRRNCGPEFAMASSLKQLSFSQTSYDSVSADWLAPYFSCPRDLAR